MKYPARCDKNHREQSMREHSYNVAMLCSQTMLQLGLSSLGNVTGLIHDCGKLTQEFVEYLRRDNPKERGSVAHSVVGAEYIYHKFYLNEKNPINKLTAQLIINAVYAHHGRLYDCINTQAENIFSQKMNKHSACGYEEITEVFFREIISENEFAALLYDAAKELKVLFERFKIDMYRAGMIQKLLYSALIDADRYDAYCFEAGAEFKCNEPVDWRTAQTAMEKKAKSFLPVDTPIDRMRCDISDRCLAAADRADGIYKLSVPTGSGKTLSSLRFALNFAQRNNKAHIFYVIPYTTIIDQTAKEVKAICGEDTVLEHHSGIVVEDDDNYRLFTQRWNAAVILTTVVQFMNALYAGKSACARRMNALCNSVIIIDEVQTIPRKMLNLFNEALNFLAEVCNTAILLCTATPPELGNLEKHPLKLAREADIVPYNTEMVQVFKRTNVVNLYTDKGMTLEEIAELAENQLDTVNSVLIVMNKVAQARAIYDFIGYGCEKIYLSSKKCGAHKLDTIEYIKKRTKQLRKNDETDKLIVVSTQLVEAGVDFSFECVIRALAGVDSIAQAAGRCNRNGEYDKICKVFAVNVSDEKLAKLADIEKAKDATKTLLLRNKDMDLLSAEAVKQYYDVHFTVDNTKQNYMDYITDDGNTIMDLLSGNMKYAREYVKSSKNAQLPVLCHAFETAGRKFRVIDNETQSVIVPYGEGKEYAELLSSGADIRTKAEIIKKCSRYSVNLYRWEFDKLKENGLYFIDDIGVWILKDEYYNDEYGIEASSEMNFLNY